MRKPEINSLSRLLRVVVLMAALLIPAQGFVCEHHAAEVTDAPGESVEICVCLCHSITVSDHESSPIDAPARAGVKHVLIDEKAEYAAVVDGIDHPPKI